MELATELSPARHIDDMTPPSFIWATARDGPGLPNALEWTRALAQEEVPVELHIYPDGTMAWAWRTACLTGDTATRNCPTRPNGPRPARNGCATSGTSRAQHPFELR